MVPTESHMEGQPPGSPEGASSDALDRLKTAILGRLKKVVWAMVWVFLGLVAFAISFPIIVLSLFFTGKTLWAIADSARSGAEGQKKKQGIYKMKPLKQLSVEKIQRISMVWATRAGMISLCWLSLSLGVPRLGKVHFLGSRLWKWALLLSVVFLLIPALVVGSLILQILISTVWGDDEDEEGDTPGDDDKGHVSVREYWTMGVAQSVILVIYFALVLHVWIIYFIANQGEIKQTHHHAPPPTAAHVSNRADDFKRKLYPAIHEYIILTLVSLLVGSIMGLARNLLMLWWKSKYIYTPDERARILVAAFRLYLLLLILRENQKPYSSWHTLMPYYWRQKRRDPQEVGASFPESSSPEQHPLPSKDRDSRINSFMKSMASLVSLSDIDEAAIWLTKRLDFTSHEIPDDLDSIYVRRIFDIYYRGRTHISAHDLVYEEPKELGVKYAKFLLELMRVDKPPSNTTGHASHQNSEIATEEFEEWMKFAHRRCFVYMNKLHGRLKSANILSKVLFGAEIFAMVIFWLFITKLATTKVMLTLGSLFLGLVFIFGDTCKAAFQGIVFAYVTRPFDIGDHVKIDRNELEVKEINIMTTVFKIITRQGKEDNEHHTVIYPNSNLAGVPITKLKVEGESTTTDPGLRDGSLNVDASSTAS